MRRDVFLDWHLGDNFGWGLVGLNLLLQWAHDADVRPLMGQPITRQALGLTDPLRIGRAFEAIDRSNRHLASLATGPDGRRRVDAIVVDALGNGFAGSGSDGRVRIGRCVFEDTDLRAAGAALGRYDAVVTASTWNADLVEAASGRRPKVVFEGVDPSLFCPGPRSGLMDDARFHVFSGGKVEFRKGQDLVLLAFRRFAERHDDAVLVTAWQSIWPERAVGFRGRLEHPVALADARTLDVRRWAWQNGVDPQRVVDIGLVPNALMPPILREMDVALQPSRAEACTNLPVKEAMACGVPVIAALNTGMRDLLDDDRAIVLRRQTPISGPDARSMDGWGDSDVDEIVDALEFAYERRDDARRRAQVGRQWLVDAGRTWRDHARELKRWLVEHDR